MESVLASDYTVEVTRVFTPDYINYISELYAAKSTTLKEKGENYTEEKIRVYFKSGRFAHGFYIVKFIGKVTVDGKDILDEHRMSELDKKYEQKTKK